jgi:hypothetical protein
MNAYRILVEKLHGKLPYDDQGDMANNTELMVSYNGR